MRVLSTPVVACCLLLVAETHAQSLIHVDVNNASPGDGSTWAKATTDLQTAIDNVQAGGQIWMAEGTYGPSSGAALPASAFWINKSVSIYGGFEGTESSVAERPCPNVGFRTKLTPIVLNQHVTSRVLQIGASSGTLDVLLDGLTIRDGGAGLQPSVQGGGIWVPNDGAVTNLTVAWCDIFANFGQFASITQGTGGGAGMSIEGPHTVDVKWCYIAGNATEFGVPGGGIYGEGATLRVFNSVLTQNQADRGSSVHLRNASGLVVNCLMTQDQVDGEGVVHLDRSTADVVNCTFMANAVSGQHHVLYTDSRGCSLTVTNSIVGIANALAATNAPTGCVSYSNIEGGNGVGVGNIDVPMDLDDDFVNIFENNFEPVAGTAVIDAGNSDMAAADVLDLDDDGDVTESVPLDLAGKPRYLNDPVAPDAGVWALPPIDMGAFERQALVGEPPPAPCHNLDF